MFGRRKQIHAYRYAPRKAAILNGDLEFAGGLHLDGRVNGNVRSAAEGGGALSVSESGYIEGSVEVTNIVMNGTVNGDMHARERLVLAARRASTATCTTGSLKWRPRVITGKLIPLGNGATAPVPAESAAEARRGGCSGEIPRVVCRT